MKLVSVSYKPPALNFIKADSVNKPALRRLKIKPLVVASVSMLMLTVTFLSPVSTAL